MSESDDEKIGLATADKIILEIFSGIPFTANSWRNSLLVAFMEGQLYGIKKVERATERAILKRASNDTATN